MDYLIVDGYNIINAWKDIFDHTNPLEDNRKILCDVLSDYQGYTGYNIVVIFDAHLVPEGKGSIISHDGIVCLFTKENQTADTLIERYVANYGFSNKITVVTNDYLEQKTVFQKGALRMTARELKASIFKARQSLEGITKDTNFIMDHLTKEEKRKLLRIKNQNE